LFNKFEFEFEPLESNTLQEAVGHSCLAL